MTDRVAEEERRGQKEREGDRRRQKEREGDRRTYFMNWDWLAHKKRARLRKKRFNGRCTCLYFFRNRYNLPN